MAPKVNKGKGVASSSHGNKRSKGTQEAPMEDTSMPQPPPRNYWRCWFTEQEELRMSGVIEEKLQQLNMDNPLSEHSRALYKVGPGFEEPFCDDDPLMRSRLESTLIWALIMMERTLRWEKLHLPPQTMGIRHREFFLHTFTYALLF
ncbi:hypothetical protein HAX54_023522 [Datura stramonium]|uniref:Uncharacterized protein n=1 Tax=Datura stramonium TaxID=4076 RepID=A0ABS8UZA2_DATST|nr:hypothetical protein [Datura stramonium]